MKSMLIAVTLTVSLLFCAACSAPKQDTAKNGETPQITSEAAKQNSDGSISGELKDFNTETLDGDSFTAAEFAKHKVTMLNIWATWCSPCVNEIPHIAQLAKEHSESDIKICGILIDSEDSGKIDKAKEIISADKADYTQLCMNDNLRDILINAHSVTALPTTFFVDSDGNIIKTVIGAKSYDSWKMIIAEVIK